MSSMMDQIRGIELEKSMVLCGSSVQAFVEVSGGPGYTGRYIVFKASPDCALEEKKEKQDSALNSICTQIAEQKHGFQWLPHLIGKMYSGNSKNDYHSPYFMRNMR